MDRALTFYKGYKGKIVNLHDFDFLVDGSSALGELFCLLSCTSQFVYQFQSLQPSFV